MRYRGRTIGFSHDDDSRPERGFASLFEIAISAAFYTKGTDFRGSRWAWEYLPPGFVSGQSEAGG
jgi:hypothetical protein